MKILIAVDGSKFGKAAVDALPSVVADVAGSSFKIISVVAYPVSPMTAEAGMISAAYYDQVERDTHLLADEYTSQAAKQLHALFPNQKLDVTINVKDGSPVREIIEIAESWHADLIVVGSHGYGFWSRALLGSVSSAIVHNASCSVLLVR